MAGFDALTKYLMFANQGIPGNNPDDLTPEQQNQILNDQLASTINGGQSQPMPSPQAPEQPIVESPATISAAKPGPISSLGALDTVLRQQRKPVADEDKYNADYKNYQQAVSDSLKNQGIGINQLEQMRNDIAGQHVDADLSPLAAYFDSIVPGSKLLEGYKRPENATEKAQRIFNLQDKIQEANTGLSKDQIAAMKTGLESTLTKTQLKAQAQRDALLSRLAMQNNSLGVREDAAAARAADAFDRHPTMVKLNAQRQQVEMDKHTLESAISDKGVAISTLKEISSGIGKAISGGGVTGLGNSERNDINNANTKWAALLQGIKPGVEYIQDPALIDFYRKTLNRLGDSYDNNLYEQAKKIANGRDLAYSHIPAAKEVIKAKVEQYNPKNLQTPTSAEPMSSEDQQAIDWAKNNSSDPRAQQILKMHGVK